MVKSGETRFSPPAPRLGPALHAFPTFVICAVNMSTPKIVDAEKRPTMRMIAQEAGVTHATVSMAMRNDPRISQGTRRKVHRIARKLGYRPDPDVAKLMHHLRMKHKPMFKSTIAALTTLSEENEPPYAVALREGARQAAEALGYGFSLFRMDADGKRNTSLQRMLRGRGVEGVLLLPVKDAISLGRFLEWNDFSVVAGTYGVLAPDFHRAVPDQFGNTLLICRHLARLGCRRIGLVAWSSTGSVVDNRFSAAVMWQNTLGGTEFVRPFIYEKDFRDGLRSWFAEERPDGLIVGTEKDARAIAGELGLRVPGLVRIAVTERPGPTIFAGIDQRAAEVGAAAAAQLHGLIQRGEKGAPAVPSVTMIKGHWIQAPRRSGRPKVATGR
jgi:DNA-binding LacI/PurR family transcriptional regulator